MNPQPVIARLRQFEGEIPWPYRCTGGEVTIGVGHAILTSEAAVSLDWQTVSSTAPADLLTIHSDYEKISAAPKGQVAKAYEDLTTIRMSDAAISRLLAEDIDSFSLQLDRELPEWREYPEPAQQAVFDMAFNLGIRGFLKFHKLLAACAQGDWATASLESHRNGIPDIRNQEIQKLFLDCQTGGESV